MHFHFPSIRLHWNHSSSLTLRDLSSLRILFAASLKEWRNCTVPTGLQTKVVPQSTNNTSVQQVWTKQMQETLTKNIWRWEGARESHLTPIVIWGLWQNDLKQNWSDRRIDSDIWLEMVEVLYVQDWNSNKWCKCKND